jgi:hypothetical protein
MQSRIRIVNSCFDKRARELYVCMGFWPLGAATRLERGDDSSTLKAASANIACSIYLVVVKQPETHCIARPNHDSSRRSGS